MTALEPMSRGTQPSSRRPVVLQVVTRLLADDVGRGIVDLARHLRAQGWESHVASAGGDLVKDLRAARLSHHELRALGSGPMAIWRASRSLMRIIGDHKVRILHAHDPASAWAAGFAARRAGPSLLVSCHGLADHRPSAWRRRFERVLTEGDRVIVDSEFLAQRLVDRHPVEATRLRTISPGIDLSLYDPTSMPSGRLRSFAKRWAIPLDRPIAFLPAPLAEERGALLVLDAARKMERPDLLIVLGREGRQGGGLASAVLDNATKDGLIERVRLVEEGEDLPILLKLADVVLLPARKALPFSRAILAAQAMGKPVIVASAGGLPEIMMPGATGWLVQPGDVDDLARALGLALSMDPQVRQRLAVRAREFAAGFGEDLTCRRTVGVYRELLRDADNPHIDARAPQAAGN